MRHLKDLPVLILGLGASGLAMARWCARHGAVVTVADTREAPASLATLQAELPDATFIGGPFTAALVEGTPIRAVYRSPGLSPATLAPVVDAAKAVGLVVGGELDLFARALLDLQTVEVPAVEAEAEVPVETAVAEPVVETPAQAELALSEEAPWRRLRWSRRRKCLRRRLLRLSKASPKRPRPSKLLRRPRRLHPRRPWPLSRPKPHCQSMRLPQKPSLFPSNRPKPLKPHRPPWPKPCRAMHR